VNPDDGEKGVNRHSDSAVEQIEPDRLLERARSAEIEQTLEHFPDLISLEALI
jgi:hypothetical protein